MSPIVLPIPSERRAYALCESDTSSTAAQIPALEGECAGVVGFVPCLSAVPDRGREAPSERPRAACLRGGALEDRHPIRRLALVALLAVATLAAAAALAVPAAARAAELQQNRDRAEAIAAEISALDAQIGSSVTRYSRATRALEAVRRQLQENRRLQRLAYRQLSLARATLAARAVAMYKHDDVSPMDAVFGAADLSDLVTQLTMVRTIARCDRDVVRTIETTKRELSDRAVKLAADERTAEKLVVTCERELGTIRCPPRRATGGAGRRALRHPPPRDRRPEGLSRSRADRRAARRGRESSVTAPGRGGRSSRARPPPTG